MSLVAAVVHRNFGVIVTDMRGMRRSDRTYVDHGRKLRKAPGGWVSVTSNGPFSHFGLNALAKVGVHSLEAITRAAVAPYSLVHEREHRIAALAQSDHSLDAGIGVWNEQYTALSYSSRSPVLHVVASRFGLEPTTFTEEGAAPGLGASVQGGYTTARGPATERFAQLLGALTSPDVPSVLRTTAQLFHEVVEEGRPIPGVSDGIEAGVLVDLGGIIQSKYLTGSANSLRHATDAEIRTAYTKPPMPPQ